MSIGVAARSGDRTLLQNIATRMKPYLAKQSPPATKCVLRGPEIRQMQCKPCQVDSLKVVMIPVYRCPKHNECTLHNTGTHPRVHACATCQDRLETAYQIDARAAPQVVLDRIYNSRAKG
jgi:hypothetical protein